VDHVTNGNGSSSRPVTAATSRGVDLKSA
jgi:hypothetical protein